MNWSCHYRTFGEEMSLADMTAPDRRRDVDSLADSGGSATMKSGIAGSLVLHILLLVLIALPWLWPVPVPPIDIVSVNLVQLGPKTTSPPSPRMAHIPQKRAETTQRSQIADITPTATVTRRPEPFVALQRPLGPKTTAKQEQNTDKPAVKKSAPRPMTAVARAHRPSANEELAARLKLLARLRLPVSAKPSRQQQQNEAGMSTASLASVDALRGRDAAYAVKDFIRTQVERH